VNGNVEQGVWIIDIKRTLFNNDQLRLVTYMRLFDITRSQLFTFIVRIADMGLVHIRSHGNKTHVRRWFDNFCRSLCYRFIANNCDFERIPDDLQHVTYAKREDFIEVIFDIVEFIFSFLNSQNLGYASAFG